MVIREMNEQPPSHFSTAVVSLSKSFLCRFECTSYVLSQRNQSTACLWTPYFLFFDNMYRFGNPTDNFCPGLPWLCFLRSSTHVIKPLPYDPSHRLMQWRK